eukprot:jgi/Chrzof1/6394/Cz18g09020.t1
MAVCIVSTVLRSATAQASNATAAHATAANDINSIAWPGVAPSHMGHVVSYAGKGNVTKLGGLSTYVAAPAIYRPGATIPAVIIFSEVYGWQLNNIRMWADHLANYLFLVFVPDFLKNDSLPTNATPFYALITKWLPKHSGEPILDAYTAVVQDIEKQYPRISKIASVGFCWGGKYALWSVSNLTINPGDAGVVIHGSFITPQDVEMVDRPVLFLQSHPALDPILNTTLYNEISNMLASKHTEGVIHDYPGKYHGFSLRGDESDPKVRADAMDAFNRAVAFLRKYLFAQAG